MEKYNYNIAARVYYRKRFYDIKKLVNHLQFDFALVICVIYTV